VNTIKKTVEKEDVKISVKVKLSALWAALMLLYIYADIFSLYRPGQIAKMMAGQMGPFPVTQVSLLVLAILMIIPAVMVFLSLVLTPRTSCWVNAILGVLYTLVNISNLVGETWAYYISSGVVEVLVTLLIVWTAARWPKREVQP
jgi:hypothetical protein